MTLQLLASDFEHSEFCNSFDCPCARAARRLFNVDKDQVAEGVNDISVEKNGVWKGYFHDMYTGGDFNVDHEVAKDAKFSRDVVIRTIELTEKVPLKNP